VGIVRVSGRALMPLVLALCGRELPPRQACYLPFLDVNGQTIDQGLALYFAAPHSFTGEDILELQAHGGPVVLQLLVQRCLQAATILAASDNTDLPHAALYRLRMAEPGEFTHRAFINGKLDLAQAEAVADLIDATTEQAARSATRSLAGAFSNEINALLAKLLDLRIWVEASIDFPEEEIDFLAQTKLHTRAQEVIGHLQAVMSQARQGALLREGLKVVIAGQPNAGKSSLLNALAGAELAIVTPVAGTTRDKISQTIQIEGIPLHVVDTAGLRDSPDPVEKIGIERAWAEIEQADAVIFLHDLSRWYEAEGEASMTYQMHDQLIANTLVQRLAPRVPVLHIGNKRDAIDKFDADFEFSHAFDRLGLPGYKVLTLSAKTGEGLSDLRSTLLELAGWQGGTDGVFAARARHLQALDASKAHLDAALGHLVSSGHLDVAAEELRLAHLALAPITGEMSSDELLGHIFSNFCIGK
jgi:tRNA modification GTPase